MREQKIIQEKKMHEFPVEFKSQLFLVGVFATPLTSAWKSRKGRAESSRCCGEKTALSLERSPSILS